MVDLAAAKIRIDEVVEAYADRLIDASHQIHANPELNDVKLWQVHTLLKGLEKIANRCGWVQRTAKPAAAGCRPRGPRHHPCRHGARLRASVWVCRSACTGCSCWWQAWGQHWQCDTGPSAWQHRQWHTCYTSSQQQAVRLQ